MPRPRRRALGTWGAHLGLAAVAYVPLLCTAPGVVGADTELDLYLDPSRFLSQVASMWDPDQSMGTVTHQYIGYLLPMGPYYALTHALGVPTWVAQRLWTGSLLFLAGAGVLFLLRTLAPSRGTGPLDLAGWGGLGAVVAALAYMLSPYVMQNEARQSVLLLPWVGLPWMVGLVARALRRGGWRHAALFALVVALVGSTNATGLLLVGVGPALWVVWELAARRVSWRRALTVTAKVLALSVAVSLWWAEGLAVESAYGMDILRYTESVPTVALTSSASETLRGLGYWYTYGVDNLGLYLPMAGPYMTSLWLLAVSFAVPALAVVGAVVTRWRQRTFFVGLVLVGTVLAVGAHPLADPTPLGRLVKTGMSDSTVGLALRSTNRATPLVVLGLAVLLGAAVAAVGARWRAAGVVAAAACAALVGADLPSLWTGQFVAANLEHPEAVPSYFQQAATYLDDQAGAGDTRVLTEPGIDFASYRWGSTLQPVLPALMTRPEVDRGLVPYGSPGSADLLMALDEEVQTLTVDPSALAPVLRLMSAGDLVVDSDLQYERYATPRPQALWDLLDPVPGGLSPPVGFGDPRVTQAEPERYPLVDETALGLPHDAAAPPPLAVFAVSGARPILRTEGAGTPMLVDGSGQGLVAAAATGLLDGQSTILYSPSLASDPAALRRQLAAGAALVVTDSNRLQAEQFGTVRENYGYTEAPGEEPLVADPSDATLPLFPASDGTDTETVALLAGVQGVQASGYGNPITYTPESRPDQALDGSLRTAWTVGAFADPVGQW
ncbi:MAG TPA: alpha-(1-_3)-arabinofuranosyltransferase family protein, partial [Acidimicrobiales bacterium]|nr:alpha-(1->3)-arabinofuranosyltransferase family protein [Acidimicrobiales bacterium]